MENKIGTLYLVPTPIGNLEDITYRAVRVLQEADVIAAEDTRHTGILLKHLDIHTPLTSYHEHNKAVKGPQLIEDLLNGKDIAVVSDAGMPAISDPGADLVELALAEHITVVPLPGPNAALTALIASGLNTREFSFIGFLPKKTANQKELLQRIQRYEGTLIFYEAPHRLEATLKMLYGQLGNRPLVLARELTKKFEEFTRTTLSDALTKYEELTERGEFVLLVGGYEMMANGAGAEAGLDDMPGYMAGNMEEAKSIHSAELLDRSSLTETDYVAFAKELIDTGLTKKDATREVAKRLGISRRIVYNAVEEYFQKEDV